MSWLPAGLDAPMRDLARAIEATFARRVPERVGRVKAFAQAELTDAFAAAEPYGLAINTTTNRLVISVLVSGVWRWRNYDGSAL